MAATISTDSYRRQARRLRCRFAGRPDRLQPALKSLSARARAASASTVRSETGFEQEKPCTQGESKAGPARRFADLLTSERGTGIVRYSQRLAWLHAARELGVERFEANLLIAAVVERGRGAIGDDVARDRDNALLQTVAVFFVIQSVVGAALWWALFA